MITYKQKQTFRLRYVWKFSHFHMCHFIKYCCEFCEWWNEHHIASVTTITSTREYFLVKLNRHPFVFYAVDNTVEHESSVYNTLNLCISYGLASVGLNWVELSCERAKRVVQHIARWTKRNEWMNDTHTNCFVGSLWNIQQRSVHSQFSVHAMDARICLW